MNNVYEIDIRVDNIISKKKVIVVIIIEKNMDYLTVEYLNSNNEFEHIVKENNCAKGFIFSVGDFFIYDGENLYNLKGNKLISLNDYLNFTIDKEDIKRLIGAAHILNNEIINFQNNNGSNQIFLKKKINELVV